MAVRLTEIAEKTRPLSAQAPLSHVIELFQKDETAQSFVLVKDKRPVGLIQRAHTFELAMSSSQGSLSRLPIGELVTAKPIIVDGALSLQDFVERAGHDLLDQIAQGCIVTEAKRYKGTLSLSGFHTALVDLVQGPEGATQDAVPPADPALIPPLLGTLAHEIRTPLTGIMGLSEILADRLKDNENKDIAETIVRSGETLDRILTDTLDYASLEAGQLTCTAEAGDVSELVSDLRRLWATEASRRNLGFRVGFIPDGPHWIDTDFGRVRQITNNLISNALKFTRDGEVSVLFSTQTLGRTLMLSVSVTDTGRGLKQDERKRFLKAFEKGDAPKGAQGWGLGLTISKALARHMDGQLLYSDNPSGGSVFTLTVPVKASRTELRGLEQADLPRKGKFELGDILLVEDHEASAMVVINALETAGWTVHHAGTVDAAESYTKMTEFQAILTDLHLPDGNAMTLIDGIRRRGGPNTATPIIAMTADITDGRRQACLAMGADRALRKPIAGPELVATIADVLMSRAAGHVSVSELRGRLAG